jgi:hypothetical protein
MIPFTWLTNSPRSLLLAPLRVEDPQAAFCHRAFGEGINFFAFHPHETMAIVSVPSKHQGVPRPVFAAEMRPDDDLPGAERVAWITEDGWQRLFKGDPDLVGRSLLFDGRNLVIDSPAGLEHLNRNIVSEVDDLFVVLDPTDKSLIHIKKVKAILKEVGMMYQHFYVLANYLFDEDKISADGHTRLEPWFKPTAFSPDLLLSTNYWMHSIIRKKLIEMLGGFNPEVDGAQDWDLSLKLSRLGCKVQHIPKVFYHWRQVPGSASRDPNAKPWAFAAQARAIEAHLDALEESQARVDFPLPLTPVIWVKTPKGM